MNKTYHPRNELVDGLRVRQHPLYFTWVNMIARCFNENSEYYKNYGGRGITVDPSWVHFKNFAKDMHPKPENATLERKNNSLGYCKDNCVWDNRNIQALNRRLFTNNTSGATGVLKTGSGRYRVRMTYEYIQYNLGLFDTFEDACLARYEFETLFFVDRSLALEMVADSEETLNKNSSTKIRGVSKSGDGFISRCTLKGTQYYVGYFETVDSASIALAEFKRLAKTNIDDAIAYKDSLPRKTWKNEKN